MKIILYLKIAEISYSLNSSVTTFSLLNKENEIINKDDVQKYYYVIDQFEIPTQYLLLYSSRTTYKILKQNLTNSDYDWILKKEIKEVIGDYNAIQITNYCLTIIKTRKRFILENMTDFFKCVEIFYYSLKRRIIPFCWNSKIRFRQI